MEQDHGDAAGGCSVSPPRRGQTLRSGVRLTKTERDDVPPQCPKCGRFLGNDLLRGGLTPEGTSCPGCGITLASGEAPGTAPRSVRPPDLSPESVHEAGDVLAGWDEDILSRDRPDSQSAPLSRPLVGQLTTLPSLVIIVSGGLAGGFVGALLSPQRRSIGAAVGTLAGAGTAVAGVHLLDQDREEG